VDYNKVLNKIYKDVKPYFGKGKVAGYIPELAKVDPGKYGMSIATIEGNTYNFGDAEEPFSIQSISKLFTLADVLNRLGSKIWTRVGREPSGNQFNSLIELEYENGIPRNPFINAGALVITDMLCTLEAGPKLHILNYLRKLCKNPNIDYNEAVADSEAQNGYRNAALANFLKSCNNLHNPIDKVLDVYFHQCAIEMSCHDLSKAALFLANKGKQPETEKLITTYRETKKINSLMLTCGLYNEVGDFAWRVGLPGKSGVGGGIVAVMPGKLAISVWAPELNHNGNSFAGIKALELFTTYTRKSIF
jgi:glutaminase